MAKFAMALSLCHPHMHQSGPDAFYMSKSIKQNVDTVPTLVAFFKDENDEPVLRRRLPLTATIGEVRKANPFGPSEVWVDFVLPRAGRLEKIELLTTRTRRGAVLYYHMNIDDMNPRLSNSESSDQVVSTVEAVIWTWNKRIKTALGADSLAVNWGGPDAKYVRADGSVLYYLDGRLAYILFEREYKSRKAFDTVTLNELSGRASVLCDLLEQMSQEVRSHHSDMVFHKRKRRG